MSIYRINYLGLLCFKVLFLFLIGCKLPLNKEQKINNEHKVSDYSFYFSPSFKLMPDSEFSGNITNSDILIRYNIGYVHIHPLDSNYKVTIKEQYFDNHLRRIMYVEKLKGQFWISLQFIDLNDKGEEFCNNCYYGVTMEADNLTLQQEQNVLKYFLLSKPILKTISQ